MKNAMRFVVIVSLLITMNANSQEKAIVNASKSEYVKLKGINIGDCKWTEGFWADKFKHAEEVMVPHMESILIGDVGHALNNFKIAAGLKDGKHQGMHWHDGDFYKWMEAAMYIYAHNKDEKILERLDGYIEIIGQAQQESGYIHTGNTIKGIAPYSERRFHEMYNSGHLMTTGCIYYRITGKKNLLDIAIKQADHLYENFWPQPKELARFGFNQTQIMGLVELYRTVGDKRYLELAELFINMRGKSKVEPHPTVRHFMIGDMVQERIPFRKSKEAVGHAVLALYFYAGAADVYAETGEQALIDALDRLWDNVTNRKMYVTGAVGQTHHGASSNKDFIHEGFINEYMMPNSTAYNETCANVCNAMFNYRMLGINGDSRHADVMELVLFNSALSGIGLDGKSYIYANPLRVFEGRGKPKDQTETDERLPYLNCFCCPPNLVRTIAKVSAWAYSLSENGIAVNLYGGNELNTTLQNGVQLQLTQETNYPWEGQSKFTIQSKSKKPFEVLFRIPEWAEGTKLTINGEDAGFKIIAGEYARVHRKWKQGDEIVLDMPMNIKLVEGHNKIEEVRNQVAVKRGPVVYCLESQDLPEQTSILDVYIPQSADLTSTYKPNILGGVNVLNGQFMLRKNKENEMYNELIKPEWQPVDTQLIPYFTWSNRGKTEMTVWLPIIWK